MKVLAVVGPSDAGKTTVVTELADRLSNRGRVATVKHLTHEPDVDTEGKDTARHRAGGASHTVGLTEDGEWFATGEDRTIDDVLDQLAPDYDYCLVEGYSDSSLPKVVLGDRSVADPVLTRAASIDALSIESVLDSVAEIESFETLSSLVAKVEDSDGGASAGSIATITGRLWGHDDPAGVPPTDPKTGREDDRVAEQIASIRADLRDREDVQTVRIHQRTGVLEASEDVVFVVVLATSHEPAITAISDAIDRLDLQL